MRHELSSDEWYEQKRGGKNKSSREHRCLGMIETPFQLPGIFVTHPFEGFVHTLAHTPFEPPNAHYGHECERQYQRADECDSYRIGHRPEEFSRGSAECVDRQITGNDDGHRIKKRTINVLPPPPD